MKLSVIIPVYKVEPYLERCVNSVLRQTFQDMEIIMVDDGSPDNSGALADKLATRDSRVHVIHQENQGLSGARNTGLRAATGDYVVFLDSDDEWLLVDGIESLMKHDGADLIIFKAVHIWKTRRDVLPNYDVTTISNLPDTQAIFKYLVLTQQFQVSACKLLVRRKLLIDDNLFFQLGMINEDIPWSFRLWQLARKVAFTNLDLYGCYHRAGSITQTTSIRYYESNDKTFSYWKEQCAMGCVNAEAIGAYLANLWVSGGYQYCSIARRDRKKALQVMKKHKDLLDFGKNSKTRYTKRLVKLFGVRSAMLVLGNYRRLKTIVKRTGV